ncbi:ABC transporter substrate-binding protein [Terasakiella sp.]|uniref:ABC transporter substrate-binding protein n=1 Tax=Terasakiella sp. TaxID=2034861 RepID=UPI003AA8F755
MFYKRNGEAYMRWALSFLFCVILVIPAYGELPARASKQLKIAFNNPGFADRGFWKDVSDTMQAAAHHFGADLHIWYGDRTPGKIRENAAEIFDSAIDFDYIIIVNEYQQLSGFLRKAEQRRIPTLFLLNSITDQQRQFIGRPGQIFKYWLGSITPDNDKAGYEMAASLLDFAHARNWQAPYSVLTLGGDNRTPASLERNGGLGRLLNENTGLREIHRAYTNWSKDQAFDETSKYLANAPAPKLIWAANDNIALGAIAAMTKYKLKAGQDYAVAGLNWSKDGLNAVRNKQFTMTHGGHFFAGAWAIVTLFDHHNNQLLEKEIHFPMEAITLNNIDEFEKKLGARDWSKIDFTRFSKTQNKTLTAYDFSLKNLLAATHP